MGKRSDFERRPRGFYPTPWAAFSPLIPHLTPGSRVAEPCAGDGGLCAHLAAAGMRIVWASDIEPQHPNVARYDATQLTHAGGADLFVTNPPWPERGRSGDPTLSILYVLSGLAPTWVLLATDWMHNLYASTPMHYCHAVVSIGRVRWIPGSAEDGKDNCCWMLFDRSRLSRGIAFTGRAGSR